MSQLSYQEYPLGPYEKSLQPQETDSEETGYFFASDSASHSTQTASYPDHSQQAGYHTNSPEIAHLENDLMNLLNQEKTHQKDMEHTQEEITVTHHNIAECEKQLKHYSQSLTELSDQGQQLRRRLNDTQNQIHQTRNLIHHSKQIQQSTSSHALYKTSNKSDHTQNKRDPAQLPVNYEPVIATIETLVQFHCIPFDFIENKLLEFRIHYQETQEKRVGWDRIFYKWTVNAWKYEANNKPFPSNFEPSEELLSELFNKGVTLEFCVQALEYFILFWKTKNITMALTMWQAQYKKWVLRAWQKHNQDEKRIQSSRPTTEEFMDTSWVDRYQFNFSENSE